MAALADVQKVFDNVSVPLSDSAVSPWFTLYGGHVQDSPEVTVQGGVRVVTQPSPNFHNRVRVVESGSGANVSYEIEGTPDGGVTVYSIQTDAAGVAVDLADVEIRVKATNASAVGAENANAWLLALPAPVR